MGSANMSHAAMTSGLEWNLKVTSQDLGHILEKFSAEFETYWHSREFLPYDAADPVPFREAIERALDRYEPEREAIRGVGFCVTIRHARFMADAFNRHGIASAAYVSGVDRTGAIRFWRS
ncbi:MAG: hypothetical protein RQ739_11095 [Desulfotignum sp.]|nr:hypothetical protein [Desulfotignum sp.]